MSKDLRYVPVSTPHYEQIMTTVDYVGLDDSAKHTITIGDLPPDQFDWWCSCHLINGGLPGGEDHPSRQDAEADAVRVHAREGDPIAHPAAPLTQMESHDTGRHHDRA